ncbi:M23 family metallopeptidase [Streptomyces sp. NPDC079020]|uniref:M23 family metallopeptidase n=1 Tax=Streptomyces sp. NPDC079020 TaxID=3365722 RepID=UPI0037D1C4DC
MLLVCALLALLTLPAAAADGPPRPPGPSGTPTAGAVVTRLYAEAARAAEAYERGRRSADVRRAEAGRYEKALTAHRRTLAAIDADLGRLARAQYRGERAGLPYAARILLADDPEQLLRAHRLAGQAERAVTRLLERARRAERALATAEQRARKAWHDLDVRMIGLAEVKRGIADRLEAAQWQLQREAERSVAAGKCAGAVRVEQPKGPPDGRSWVAPVETYELSAGFDSAGAHWANRHTGQDFAVDIGTPVRSVGAGRVVSVSCGGAFGVEVLVRHLGDYYTQYAHLAGVAVDQGEQVHAGQWVGRSGTTGNSTGPHLHFEVRLTPQLGSGVDPARWLRGHGVRI